MANEFKIKKGLIVTGASGGTVVDIQGSQGQLFSVTDNLSGEIFAVADISGVPIMSINSSSATVFTGLVSGITPTAAANFVTKAYVDGSGGGTGPFLPLAGGTLTGSLISTENLGSASIYINSSRPSLGFTDTDSFPDPNDIYLIRGSSGAKLVFQFYDDSAGTTTETFSIDPQGNSVFQNTLVAKGNITSQTTGGAGLNLRRDDTSISGTNTLGSIAFQGDDPTDGTFNNGAAIFGKADGSWSSGAYPGQLLLQTRNTTGSLVTALTLAKDQNATFGTQAFATTATSTGDASSTLTTKGYVDSLITGATIYRGTWQAGISATSTGTTSSSTTLTVSAAILDIDGNTPTLVGAVVTGAGITGTVKVASVTSSTVYELDTAIDATATAYIFSPIYGAPDLSGVTQTSGYYYICSEAGSATPNGAGTEPNTWSVGDWVIWNDDVGSGEWQKVDNSSVLSGAGTGQTVALWQGASSVTDSETLGNAPITVSGNNTTFAGEISSSDDINVNNGKLVVNHTSAEVRIKSSSDTGESYINFSDPSDINPGQIYYGHTDNKMVFRTNDLQRITIDSSGNVGINTDDPGSKLQIKTATNQNIAFNLISGGSLNGIQRITSYNDAITASVPMGISALELYFLTGASNAEAMRITSAGGISFGSTGTAYGTSGQVLTSAGNASPTWTTPTTGTVTGSGTATQVAFWNTDTSLSGNNELYWDNTNGYLGINDTTPNSRLKVTSGTSDTSIYTVDINHVRNDADVATHAMRLNVDLSGADTTTGDRLNSGLLIDIDSSANGDASNEHRIYGVNSAVNFTGYSDLVRGGYFLAESNYTGAKTAQLAGVFGSAVHDANATTGGVSNMYGVYGVSSIQDKGDVDNAFGTLGIVTIANNRTEDVGVTKGVEGRILIDKETALNYGTMIGISSVIDNNEGSVPNFGSQYLFKGDYQGTKGSTAWGIYTEGDKNYFEGKIGIGTTDPDTLLDVSDGTSGATAPAIRITNTLNLTDWSSNTEDLGRYEFYTDDTSGNAPYTLGYIGIKNDYTSGTPTLPSGAMIFATTTYNASGGAVERMRITSAGNVGIGETNPTSGLVVRKDTVGGRGGEISIVNYAANTIGNEAALNFGLEASTYHADFGNAQIKARLNGVTGASTDMMFSTWNGSSFGERMRIDSGGNVGIGDTSPDYRLSVAKTSAAAPAIMVSGAFFGGPRIQTYGLDADSNAWMGLGTDMSGAAYEHNLYFSDTGSAGRLSIGTYNGTTYSEKMCVLRTGNVGIGTTSPDAILETSKEVDGNQVGALLTNTRQAGTADSVSLNFGLGRTADGYIRSVSAVKLLKEQQWTGTVSTVDASLVFSTVQNETVEERARIKSNGHFQVNTGYFELTSQPSTHLWLTTNQVQLYSGGLLVFAGYNSSNDAVVVGNESGDINVTLAGGANNKVLYLEGSSGNVGIGTKTPNAKLDVQGTQGQLFSVTDDLSGDIFAVADISGVPIMLVNSNGKVGIGTTIPGAALEVFGTGNSFRLDSAANGSKEILFRNVGTGTATIKTDGDLKLYVEDTGKNILFDTTGGEKMRILANGNVGINTTNPLAKLTVNQDSFSDTEGIFVQSGDNAANGGVAIFKSATKVGTISSLGSASSLTFMTDGGNERVRISSAGAIKFNAYGAGTLVTDASGNITVSSGGGAGGPFLPLAGGTMTGTSGVEFPEQFKLKWKNSSTSTEVFSITSTGGTNSIVSGDGTNSVKTKFFVGDGGLELNSNDPTGLIADFGYGGISLRQSNVEQLATTSSGISVKGGDKGQPGYTFIGDTNTGMYSDTADQLDFATGGNIAMVIDSSSNVGIGTTSPDGKLEIVQTSGDGTPTLIVANDISGVSGYTFQSWRYVDGNTNFRLDLKQKTLSGVVKYAFDMVNNGTGFNDVLVLDRGNVGIGTASPDYKLEVAGTMFSQGNFGNRNSAQTIGVQFEPGSTTATTMAVYSDELKIYYKGPNTTRFEFEEDGTARKPGGGSWSSTSDERVKKDITSYTKGLTEILAIQPVNYKYNGKAGLPEEKLQVGVIAQDIQAAFPDAVETYKALFNNDDTEETELLAFNPSELTFTLINAVKELKAEIELLKQQTNN